MRALVRDAAEMPGMVARGLAGAQSDIDRDPRCTQSGMPLPADVRIRILDRRDNAGKPGRDDGIRARRRAAEMRAGFERDIERGAAGGATCPP